MILSKLYNSNIIFKSNNFILMALKLLIKHIDGEILIIDKFISEYMEHIFNLQNNNYNNKNDDIIAIFIRQNNYFFNIKSRLASYKSSQTIDILINKIKNEINIIIDIISIENGLSQKKYDDVINKNKSKNIDILFRLMSYIRSV